jgi:aspartyl-tRNA(Asn)/glutamyl-tRNA(Gln) amidotransferase subunit C
MELKDEEALAALARLDQSEEEKQSILKDMEGILDYVKVIESVEVDEVDVEYDTYNVWRDDVLEEREFSRESIIEQFPASQGDFLKVKKIL